MCMVHVWLAHRTYRCKACEMKKIQNRKSLEYERQQQKTKMKLRDRMKKKIIWNKKGSNIAKYCCIKVLLYLNTILVFKFSIFSCCCFSHPFFFILFVVFSSLCVVAVRVCVLCSIIYIDIYV